MAVSRAAAVSVRWYLIALLVGVAIVGGFWWQARGALYPVLPDTTTYLEMSRSFLRHGRFEVVPYALTTPAVTSAPTALWPPLYPIAIAALSVTGVRDLVAAPLINRVCFALLPVLLLWALAGAAHPRRIIAAAALALTAPGVLGVQFFGLSEGLTVVWLVLAVGCALRTERSAMLLLSGLCSGAAYVTRNPALAVSAAIPLWLVFDAPSRADVPRRLLSGRTGGSPERSRRRSPSWRCWGARSPFGEPCRAGAPGAARCDCCYSSPRRWGHSSCSPRAAISSRGSTITGSWFPSSGVCWPRRRSRSLHAMR